MVSSPSRSSSPSASLNLGKIVFWRITRAKYDKIVDAFSGAGAAQYPGRWNGPGVPVVYTACSIALGVLEILVHAKSRAALDDRFVLFSGLADPDLVFRPDLPAEPAKLPKSESRRIGNEDPLRLIECGEKIFRYFLIRGIL